MIATSIAKSSKLHIVHDSENFSRPSCAKFRNEETADSKRDSAKFERKVVLRGDFIKLALVGVCQENCWRRQRTRKEVASSFCAVGNSKLYQSFLCPYCNERTCFLLQPTNLASKLRRIFGIVEFYKQKQVASNWNVQWERLVMPIHEQNATLF